MDFDDLPGLDAKTFQEPLGKLAEAMAQKVWREGSIRLQPAFVAEDLFMIIRHSITTYDFLFYLNADERREQDCFWRTKYGVVTAPLVRTLIDCLYNVTAILENPTEKGILYRKSGLKKRLGDIEEDEQNYGGKPDWDTYLRDNKWALRGLIGKSNFTDDDVRKAKGWQTLGRYLDVKSADMTSNQRFLKTFTLAQWRQYSALSHAACEGYIGDLPAGMYFIEDALPHENRTQIEKAYPLFMTRHLGRAALILLCLVTELQISFRFDGADINKRIMGMWKALVPLFEAKELFDEHYAGLLKEKGIAPSLS